MSIQKIFVISPLFMNTQGHQAIVNQVNHALDVLKTDPHLDLAIQPIHSESMLALCKDSIIDAIRCSTSANRVTIIVDFPAHQIADQLADIVELADAPVNVVYLAMYHTLPAGHTAPTFERFLGFVSHMIEIEPGARLTIPYSFGQDSQMPIALIPLGIPLVDPLPLPTGKERESWISDTSITYMTGTYHERDWMANWAAANSRFGAVHVRSDRVPDMPSRLLPSVAQHVIAACGYSTLWEFALARDNMGRHAIWNKTEFVSFPRPVEDCELRHRLINSTINSGKWFGADWADMHAEAFASETSAAPDQLAEVLLAIITSSEDDQAVMSLETPPSFTWTQLELMVRKLQHQLPRLPEPSAGDTEQEGSRREEELYLTKGLL